MTRKVTQKQAEAALAVVAAWLGKKGYGPEPGAPAPTGPEAAASGLGPQLVMDWDWPSSGPTPTLLLEGGPYDWAIEVAATVSQKVRGVFAEPYAGYALCLYPD